MIVGKMLKRTVSVVSLDLSVILDLAPENIECLWETKLTVYLGASHKKLINIAMKVTKNKTRKGH